MSSVGSIKYWARQLKDYHKTLKYSRKSHVNTAESQSSLYSTNYIINYVNITVIKFMIAMIVFERHH